MARILQNIDNEALYQQLKVLVDSMPDIRDDTDEIKIWLGRLQALVEETGNVADAVGLTTQAKHLRNRQLAPFAVEEIKSIMFRALARAEVRAPAAARGAFIAAKSPFDAFAAVGKVLSEARADLLIVDPYMDAALLTEFAPLAAEGVVLRLLSDEASIKDSLKPAAERWQNQHGDRRPVEVRLAAARSLHDRSVFIDRSTPGSLHSLSKT